MADPWHLIGAPESEPIPENEPVLIFLPEGATGLPEMEVAVWLGADDETACWWTNGGPNAGSDMEEWRPTHWRRLPPKPGDP